MSELTPCNFCSLNHIEQRAKKKGKYVMLRDKNNWIDVYVYPANINLDFDKKEIRDNRKARKSN
jgi:hypothetical protein